MGSVVEQHDLKIHLSGSAKGLVIGSQDTLILSGSVNISSDATAVYPVGITVQSGGHLIIRPGTEIKVEGPLVKDLTGLRILRGSHVEGSNVKVHASGGSKGIISWPGGMSKVKNLTCMASNHGVGMVVSP